MMIRCRTSICFALLAVHLLAIGPLSQTYNRGKSEDPAKWTEIFSPDLDCTVRNVRISGVRLRDSQTDLPIEQVEKVERHLK
jgi:hypothetical protein